MASLHFNEQHGRYRIRFDFGGQSYNRSLGKITGKPGEAKADAEATLARVEKTLGLLRDSFLTVPDGADHAQFILTGGKETGRPKAATVKTLQDLFSAAKAHTPSGTKEEHTLETEEYHRNHLVRLLGGRTQLRLLKPSDLQAYIATRSAETYRGTKVSAQTIRKEIGRLQADWNRAAALKLLVGLGGPPTKALEYPKDSEKSPFRTWEQINAILAREGKGDRDGKAFKGVFTSDGRRMRWVEGGKAEDKRDTPKQLGDTVRAMVTRVGVLVPFFGISDPTGKDLAIDEQFKVSDFKLDKREKVGEREAQVVRYALHVKGAKEPLAARVWLNTKTNLPLKRVITTTTGADTITLTKTCTKLTLDPRIDAKKFEFPDK